MAGVETSTGTVEADVVVDAAGPQHWLARRLNLPITYHSASMTARFGYAGGFCVVREETPALLADQTGWTWTAKVAAGLYHWTRLNLDGSAPTSTYFPHDFAGLRPRGPSRGADVAWRTVEASAGPGYFMAGDAAGVLDPASSHGILRALLSGMVAGRLIVERLLAGSSEVVSARSYREWLGQWFFHDISALHALYGRLPRPPAWICSSLAPHGAQPQAAAPALSSRSTRALVELP